MKDLYDVHCKVHEATRKPITTMILRNIPCRISRDVVMQCIDDAGFANRYDFLSLPVIETKREPSKNLGYAFVNFLTEDDARTFQEVFSGYRFRGTQSDKVCQVEISKSQGLEENLRLRNSKSRQVVDAKTTDCLIATRPTYSVGPQGPHESVVPVPHFAFKTSQMQLNSVVPLKEGPSDSVQSQSFELTCNQHGIKLSAQIALVSEWPMMQQRAGNITRTAFDVNLCTAPWYPASRAPPGLERAYVPMLLGHIVF
jgi:hypothetical protein